LDLSEQKDLELPAGEPDKVAAHQRVMARKQLPLAAVAKSGELRSRVDDVGENHRREDALGI
jgi:hypothetical protein